MKYLYKLVILSFILVLTTFVMIECDKNTKDDNKKIQQSDSSTVNNVDLNNTEEYRWGYTLESYNIIKKEFDDDENLYYAMDWIGKEPIEIDMKTFESEKFDISSLKGKKFILEIVRADCESCRKTTPIVKKQIENSDVILVSIFYSDSEKDVIEKFYEDLGMEKSQNEIILSSSREESEGFIQSYRISRIPTLIFVDENFKISNISIEEINEDEMKSKLFAAFDTDKKLYQLEKE